MKDWAVARLQLRLHLSNYTAASIFDDSRWRIEECRLFTKTIFRQGMGHWFLSFQYLTRLSGLRNELLVPYFGERKVRAEQHFARI